MSTTTRANTHHGLLLVSNDDRVAPGRGFGTHGHRDMEIVTWVLDGSLRHEDSIGTNDVITPGLAQRMSAGSGIRHSEVNANATEPVHLIQMWVPPDTQGLTPEYEQTRRERPAREGRAVPARLGRREPDAAITIHQRDATLWVGRLAAGDEVVVPEAPFVHVFVGPRRRHVHRRRSRRARSRRATRSAWPTRNPSRCGPVLTAPRSSSGRPTPTRVDFAVTSREPGRSSG